MELGRLEASREKPRSQQPPEAGSCVGTDLAGTVVRLPGSILDCTVTQSGAETTMRSVAATPERG